MNLGPSMILPALLAVSLVVAAGFDLRWRIIPNSLNAAIALAAPVGWWAAGMALWPDAAMQLGVAFAVFAAFVGLFALGGIGGGDVKLIGALALWIDYRLILSLLLVMAIVGGVIAAVMLVQRKWTGATDIAEVPYGVAIAAAGLWALHQQYINHWPLIPAA